jgi:hypothetical protein
MRLVSRVALPLLALILAVIGYAMAWTTFMAYDDEGYVLYSLRAFADTGGLYERVYSQYGPFFFLWNKLIGFVGFDYTNTGARVITLIYWMIAATASAAIVLRATRNLFAAGAAMTLTFWHLWPMINEPSHPGGVIAAMVAAAAWLAAPDTLKPDHRALIIGAIGAALVLTKINVGVFFLAGATAWWVISARESTDRTSRIVVGLALVALPLMLMRPLLASHKWVLIFAIVTAVTGFALAMISATPRIAVSLNGLWRGVVAGLAVTAATVLFIRATGTSWSGIIEGVVLAPLRHPMAYTAEIRWRPGSLSGAIASVAVLLLLVRRAPERRFVIVAVVRATAVLGYLLCWSRLVPLEIHGFINSYGLAAIPWFVIPARDNDSAAPMRAWLGLLVITQALHAYPVAGSQISWGTFLWVPLAACGMSDVVSGIAEQARAGVSRVTQWGVAGVVTVLTLASAVPIVSMVATRLPRSDALALPGAESIFLPHSFTSTIRILSLNAAVHAEPLFSLPGMLSFHQWTGVEPPTTRNTTHWFTLLSVDDQEKIRERLAASPRSCVIVQRTIYDFLVDGGIATESPLTQWLHREFEPAFKLQTFEFWVRRGRTIAPVGTVRARESTGEADRRYRFEIIMANPALRDVATITLDRLADDGDHTIETWNRENAVVHVTPINSAGNARSEQKEATWPFSAGELARVEVFTNQFNARGGFRGEDHILQFRDATGRVLGEARFID